MTDDRELLRLNTMDRKAHRQQTTKDRLKLQKMITHWSKRRLLRHSKDAEDNDIIHMGSDHRCVMATFVINAQKKMVPVTQTMTSKEGVKCKVSALRPMKKTETRKHPRSKKESQSSKKRSNIKLQLQNPIWNSMKMDEPQWRRKMNRRKETTTTQWVNDNRTRSKTKKQTKTTEENESDRRIATRQERLGHLMMAIDVVDLCNFTSSATMEVPARPEHKDAEKLIDNETENEAVRPKCDMDAEESDGCLIENDAVCPKRDMDAAESVEIDSENHAVDDRLVVKMKKINNVDSTLAKTAHTAQCSPFTSVERTSRAWLKSHGLQRHFCALENCLSSGPHMSHLLLLLCHLPCTTSTSSSSFTLPSTTTPEHAQQSGQHDPHQEYSAHHQPLQERPVDKLRHQESLWRGNQQSGGNLRDCLKDLEDNRSLSIVRCTGKIWRRRSPSSDHRRSEGIWRNWDGRCAGFLDDSVGALQILISKMESYKRHWLLVCPERFGETRCIGHAGERGKCTIHSSRTKRKFEVSIIWRSESFGETQCIVFICAGKPDQESCVQKR